MNTDERVYEAIAHTDHPRKAIAPGGDTIEVTSLATIRDLAEELGISETSVRMSVRRLTDAGRVQVWNLRDLDAGVRRLYVTTEQIEQQSQVPTIGDLLSSMFAGSR